MENNKKQYRIKPFRIKDIELTGFSNDDGVISQKITAKGSFTDSTFAIQLTLNQEGVELWKESAQSEFWDVEPAMLTYKIQANSDGQLEWREMSYQINIESLPACAILGEDCTDHINERLATHEQYVQCRSLLDN
ncbi:hypothetical protein PN36_17235 [Candidatus Thiomargarita nelsonii]|uniref:Uncharacterized protein n=1 Tax=Candidatus Thiomargarita nelsonii TaxID=1003181 RepID=A0A4E0QNG4_9GAMM|nr:hypothetical protein PN36_17235 [Candidatus Thiomargarita nelsonii]